jgi:hypothetical protein
MPAPPLRESGTKRSNLRIETRRPRRLRLGQAPTRGAYDSEVTVSLVALEAIFRSTLAAGSHLAASDYDQVGSPS